MRSVASSPFMMGMSMSMMTMSGSCASGALDRPSPFEASHTALTAGSEERSSLTMFRMRIESSAMRTLMPHLPRRPPARARRGS